MIRKNLIRICSFIAVFVLLNFQSFAAAYYTVPSGQSRDICEHSTCRRVTNSGGSSIFVPTNTAAEWAAFRSTPPSGTSMCDHTATSSCGGWGACSTTCGSGTQSRTCINGCGGSFSESQGCTDNSGYSVVSSYGGWGACSTTCGWGTQYRTVYYVCGNTGTQSQSCYNCGSCGVVSSCSGWGGCSASCGPGTMYRTCYYACGGSYTDSAGCNNGACGPCGNSHPCGVYGTSYYRYAASGGGCGGGTACVGNSVVGSCGDCPCAACDGSSPPPGGGGLSCSSVSGACLIGGGRFRLDASGGGCGGGTACNSQGQQAGSCEDCPCGSCS